MRANQTKETSSRLRSKERKFFGIGYSSSARVATGMDLVNENRLLRKGESHFIADLQNPGFWEMREVPKFRCTVPAIRGLHDKIDIRGFWMVSERMKAVLVDTDPDAFAFAPCEIVDSSGTPGPTRWLCDVVRVIDALDEFASDVEIEHRNGQKAYSLLKSNRRIYNSDLVGSAHIFRMEHLRSCIVCDDVFRDACKAASLKVLRFGDAVNSKAKTPQKWVVTCRRYVEASSTRQTLREKKDWVSKSMLAEALVELGKHENGITALAEAIAIYRDLQTARLSYPFHSAMLKTLRKTISILSERENSADALEEAKVLLREGEKRLQKD